MRCVCAAAVQVWRQGHESVKELLTSMLEVEPVQRPNARECLRHPWASGAVFNMLFGDLPAPLSASHSSDEPQTPIAKCISVPRFDVLMNEEGSPEREAEEIVHETRPNDRRKQFLSSAVSSGLARSI